MNAGDYKQYRSSPLGGVLSAIMLRKDLQKILFKLNKPGVPIVFNTVKAVVMAANI